MKVKVLFFAGLKDIAGTDSLQMEINDGSKLAHLLDLIVGKVPALNEVIGKRKVFISVNQEMADKEDILKDGDEVGLLPPFSGG